MKYAEVVLDGAPINKRLTYAIPESMREEVRVGSKVSVPLGKANRPTWAYIVDFIDKLAFDPSKIKEIIPQTRTRMSLPDELLHLAHWMADYYMTPLSTILKTMVPSAVRTPDDGHKYIACVRKNATMAELRKACAELSRKAPKQAAVLDVMLKKSEEIAISELCAAAHATPAAVKALIDKGLLKSLNKKEYRSFLKDDVFIQVPHKRLNDDQQRIFDRIKGVIDARRYEVSLMHGVTGSGKTELYLQLVDYALQKGRSAIIMVPEIALTPQTIAHFKSRFAKNVAVLHHRLSKGERHDEWHRILTGELQIVIGPRSAIFAPVKNLGIIVLDEEHDHSYKQSDLQPRYHAREVALIRAQHENAVVVLGSATPSLESYQAALDGAYHIDQLPARIDDRPLAAVKIIDMRLERQKNNRYIVISDPLLEAIDDRIKNGEQVILFLNRRGYANMAMCNRCGEVMRCQHCSISLKYHSKDQTLVCHLCGYTAPMVALCPACKAGTIGYKGIGTERIEKMLYAILKEVRVLRMDFDTTQKKHSHDMILNDFRRAQADILLGTQMIAKGLDFPNVTLVGILDADVSLHLQDFRAAEQTFQIITQVAGRAGRGEIPGEVFIQTMHPDHPAIAAASRQDYDAFYRSEIDFRRELAYPPFTHILSVSASCEQEDVAMNELKRIAESLRQHITSDTELLGPSAAPIARIKDQHRWQLFLKGTDISAMSRLIKTTLDSLKLKSSVKLAIDVEPLSLL